MALHTKQQLLQLFLVILIAAKAASQPNQHCPGTCGSLSIPYPFGTEEGCYLDDSFFISCNHGSSTPIPFLGKGNITVLNISLDGELLVSSPVAHDCYGIKGNGVSTEEERKRSLDFTHFSISSSRNNFTAIGCDTVGEFVGYSHKEKHTSTKGCVSTCSTVDDIINSGSSCSGSGCCQIQIPNGLTGFSMETWSRSNHSTIHGFNPCGYAFVVAEGAYKFTSTDLQNFENKTVPMELDWAVGNQTCQEAQLDFNSYACKANNSECHNSTSGNGYRCKCESGFHGNPYLRDGCKGISFPSNISACNMKSNPCSRICHHVHGTFKCSCPKGYEGDGMRNGTGCQLKDKPKGNLILIIGLSLSLSLLAALVGCINLYPQLRERKLIKKRENYFQQNGGILLQQQIAGHQDSTERATIFTTQELKKATNNYDEARVVGKGAHGTVYKGILSNGKVVAIKKSKISNQSEIEQFINEVVVLSQINHRNVVKLLGCCLETEVPLLVYEFITNGTLFEHLHAEGKASQLSWTTRLTIATETAEALAYLHSAASTPIIHRDVKSANILLDDNLTAKVSDFGASKLVPLDQTQLSTLVQGTLGYLDPEYLQSSQLTEKSDVYSFGVVLAELLTSKMALSFLRPEGDRNLSMHFVSSMREGRLCQILDNEIVNHANFEHIIEVANLAKRCLRLKGEERPTMKEVAMELEGLRVMQIRSLGVANNVSEEETEFLIEVAKPNNIVDIGDGSGGSSSIMTRFDSLQNQILEPLGDGR